MTAEGATEDRLPSHVFRFVERELYDYPVNKEKVIDYLRRRDELLHRGRQWPENDGRKEDGPPTDIPYQSTVRLLVMERSAERARFYVDAIDSVMRTLNEEERRFVKRKYLDDDTTNEVLARELNMGKERYYRMRTDVIRKFALRFGVM